MIEDSRELLFEKYEKYLFFDHWKAGGVIGGGGLVIKSCLTLVTPWIVAIQVPLSMGFSRREYQSGLLLAFPGDFLDLGIKPRSPALQADSLPTELQGKLWGNHKQHQYGDNRDW